MTDVRRGLCVAGYQSGGDAPAALQLPHLRVALWDENQSHCPSGGDGGVKKHIGVGQWTRLSSKVFIPC